MAILVDNLYEIRVFGQAQGQAIQNVFHYWCTNEGTQTASLEELAVEFQAQWQAAVCPLLHEDYSVINYEALHVHDVEFLPNQSAPDGKTRLVYDELHSEQGTGSDVGAITTDPLPTYAAIGFRKSCGQTKDETGVAWPSGGLLSGGFRLGPIAEAYTEASDGNSLTATAITAATGVETPLLQLAPDDAAAILQMVVVSLQRNKLPRLTIGNLPTFAFAQVNAFTVNPLITTQNTRKARVRYG